MDDLSLQVIACILCVVLTTLHAGNSARSTYGVLPVDSLVRRWWMICFWASGRACGGSPVPGGLL